MSAPEPMLSTTTLRWPAGGEWVLQPKWDGFRLLIDVGADGRVRAWSRRGASLSDRLEAVMNAFADSPAGSIFDGELVAVSEHDGLPVQDFATVCRGVLQGDAVAAASLRFVAFDLLALDGRDLRGRPWRERDERLAGVIPVCRTVRRIESLPATPGAHAAVVALGFEGTVLKRPGSIYRPGRHATWRKHKARHTVEGTLVSVRRDREGHWHGVCDVNGRRITALAGERCAEAIEQSVVLVYSRVDAGGALREARIVTGSRL